MYGPYKVDLHPRCSRREMRRSSSCERKSEMVFTRPMFTSAIPTHAEKNRGWRVLLPLNETSQYRRFVPVCCIIAQLVQGSDIADSRIADSYPYPRTINGIFVVHTAVQQRTNDRAPHQTEPAIASASPTHQFNSVMVALTHLIDNGQ
jgi:hypothetical protein